MLQTESGCLNYFVRVPLQPEDNIDELNILKHITIANGYRNLLLFKTEEGSE